MKRALLSFISFKCKNCKIHTPAISIILFSEKLNFIKLFSQSLRNNMQIDESSVRPEIRTFKKLAFRKKEKWFRRVPINEKSQNCPPYAAPSFDKPWKKVWQWCRNFRTPVSRQKVQRAQKIDTMSLKKNARCYFSSFLASLSIHKSSYSKKYWTNRTPLGDLGWKNSWLVTNANPAAITQFPD